MGLLAEKNQGCQGDAMAFTPATAKLIFMKAANHPGPMAPVRADYNNPNRLGLNLNDLILRNKIYILQISFLI